MQIKITFFILFTASICFSQEYGTIKDLNKSIGLPSNYVYTVDFDKDNYAWICTDNGVSKYNGSTHKIFNRENGLPTNDINEIHIDKKNRKWLKGYYEGLYYIENDSIKKINTNLDVKSFKKFYEYKDKIIFLNDTRCFILDSKNQLSELRIDSKYFFVDFDKLNNIFIVSDDFNEYFYSPANKKFTKLTSGFKYYMFRIGDYPVFYKSNDVLEYRESNDLRIDNLYFFKNNTFQKLPTNFRNSIKSVRFKGEFDESHFVYYDTIKNKYHVIENGKLDVELAKKVSKIPFPNSKIQRIFIDNDHNFWVGFQDFSMKYIPNDFTKSINYDFTEYFQKKKTSIKFSCQIQSKVYYTTYDNNLWCFDLTSKRNELINKLKKGTINKLYIRNNELNISFQDGIEVFQINNDNSLSRKKIMNTPNRVSEFSNIGLVYAKYNKVIFRENDTLFQVNSETRINRLKSTKNYIIGSNEELLFQYDIVNKKVLENSSIKFSNVIYPFKNQILIGTLDGQIFLLDNKLKIINKLFTESDKVTAIHYDDTNQFFYIGVGEKLYVLKIEKSRLKLVKLITHSDGLSLSEISSISSNHSHITIVTVQGLSQLEKKIIFNKPNKNIDIDINYIRVDGKIFDYGNERLFLERNQNSIVFETSIKSFFNNNSNLKKFISLTQDDDDKSWEAINEDVFSFNDLAPGDYSFSIFIDDLKGIKKSKTVEFTINPHFWERSSFKIICTLILLSLIGFTMLYLRDKRNKKIRAKVKLNDLELKALKAQMNPHFIFNSLNNIQSTMIFQGVEKFNTQMVNFSNLLRKTLDIVNKDSITLADEIDYISSYVAIENLRLNPKINLIYDIDEEINLTEKIIPVMFVQPIVENAIIHGLSGINTERILKITIKKIENKLQIEIENNGVGRNTETKPDKIKNHTSYATKIVSNRMKLYQELTKKEYTYEIIDLVDENSKAIGTKVVLNVPIVNDKTGIDI